MELPEDRSDAGGSLSRQRLLFPDPEPNRLHRRVRAGAPGAGGLGDGDTTPEREGPKSWPNILAWRSSLRKIREFLAMGNDRPDIVIGDIGARFPRDIAEQGDKLRFRLGRKQHGKRHVRRQAFGVRLRSAASEALTSSSERARAGSAFIAS